VGNSVRKMHQRSKFRANSFRASLLPRQTAESLRIKAYSTGFMKQEVLGREREREREESWGGSERDYRVGGGCNRNIMWQFGRFPGSAR
jgi:hypothetical protein